MTLEEAKDKVAQNWDYKNWEDFRNNCKSPGCMESMMEEVAEVFVTTESTEKIINYK